MEGRFSQRWLDTLCRQLPNVHSAVFVVPEPEQNRLHQLATWPRELAASQDFLPIAKYALKKRGDVCLARAHVVDGDPLDYFARPVYIRSRLAGVLAIKMKHLDASRHGAVFSRIRRAIMWLGMASVEAPEQDGFYNKVVGMLAGCFEQGSYRQGLMRMVAELTSQFACERVAFGELRGHHSQVLALSNSAGFDQRSNQVRAIAELMDEAIEQDQAIRFPDPEGRAIVRAHREYSRKFGAGSIATIPLIDRGEVFAAVSMFATEETPFDDDRLDLAQQTLSLLSPYLALKRDQERGLARRLIGSIGDGLRAVFGLRYLQLKLLLLVVAMTVALVSIGHGQFSVTADAVLEGKVQRVVAAPISGFLLSSSVRPGDMIREGDVLATLNDAELKLELARLVGEQRKLRREYREAQSERDLVKVRVLREQISQAEAQIDLVKNQLDNISLTAPFDGVVIEGDLSQQLGSPVERGEVLFKVAPLADYRIILKVDESLIAYLETGQAGLLTLSSLSDRHYPLRVERISSMTRAEDGANIFRVEASLPNAPPILRPGMAGIGKIYTGEERLIWIWTHELVSWLRLWLWSWLA